MIAPQITHADASRNIISFATEGRLIQHAWHKKHEGREMACLLGSMHVDVSKPSDCNGDLMPLWLAELTPTLFDGIPSGSVKDIGLRYGALIARWHAFKPATWRTIQTRFLIKLVDDAVESARPVAEKYAFWAKVDAACKQVVEALQGGENYKLKAAADAAAAAAAARWAAADRWAAAAAAAAYERLNFGQT